MFNPQFGMFWDRAPGVYGDEFAKAAYELTEGIGAGGAVKLETLSWGNHGETIGITLLGIRSVFRRILCIGSITDEQHRNG